MERTTAVSRRYRRQTHPKRVIWLKLLCVFAALALAALLVCSPAGRMILARGSEPLEGGKVPGLIDAPFIDQRDKYPTGCESVTAVMALQYAGVEISVEEFIDGYLPQGNAPYTDESGTLVGADPWREFLGSPYSESGWGCYAPVIAGGLERLLQDRDIQDLSVKELEGESLESLCRAYVDKGVPVMLWATIGMEQPVESTQFVLEDTGRLFTWIYPLHCLLLTGGDGECYYFNDPLAGKNVPYPKDQVKTAYQGVGMQAVVLV